MELITRSIRIPQYFVSKFTRRIWKKIVIFTYHLIELCSNIACWPNKYTAKWERERERESKIVTESSKKQLLLFKDTEEEMMFLESYSHSLSRCRKAFPWGCRPCCVTFYHAWQYRDDRPQPLQGQQPLKPPALWSTEPNQCSGPDNPPLWYLNRDSTTFIFAFLLCFWKNWKNDGRKMLYLFIAKVDMKERKRFQCLDGFCQTLNARRVQYSTLLK